MDVVMAERARSAITTSISSVSPNYHFNRIAHYILNIPLYTGFGMGPQTDQPGQTQTTTTVMQSLASAWPNMLVLTLATVLMFIASYMLFTRQEIR